VSALREPDNSRCIACGTREPDGSTVGTARYCASCVSLYIGEGRWCFGRGGALQGGHGVYPLRHWEEVDENGTRRTFFAPQPCPWCALQEAIAAKLAAASDMCGRHLTTRRLDVAADPCFACWAEDRVQLIVAITPLGSVGSYEL